MRPVGFVLALWVLLATAGSHTGIAANPFDQKLSKDKQAVHALNRLTFGARPGEVEQVRRLGVEHWIRAQLRRQRVPESPVLDTRLKPLDTLQMTTAQMIAKYPRTATRIVLPPAPDKGSGDPQATAMALAARTAQLQAILARPPGFTINQQLIAAKLFRARYSDRQLEEVLVDFWLNHFNVFNGKGQVSALLTSYERDAIRPHVLGRFPDLLLATARHPAMLFYLDNWQSRVAPDPTSVDPGRRLGLNENYGRELMELHTLGVNGGYSQQDVIAVARAFTGWTIREPNRVGEFLFDPSMHDDNEKIVLGHTIAAGGGEQDGLRVIEILSRHPSTARFISRKLAQRFVADAPPQALVDRMTDIFIRTGGDLHAVIETMLLSREFLSEGAWQAKLKSPLELVLSAVRAVDAEVADPAALAQHIADLGQPLYGKGEPTGYPDAAEAWANSAGFLGRINFVSALVANQIKGVTVDATRLPRKPADASTRLVGIAPSRTTRTIYEKGLANKTATPATVAAIVLASPDFQRK